MSQKITINEDDFRKMMVDSTYYWNYRIVHTNFCKGKTLEEVAKMIEIPQDNMTIAEKTDLVIKMLRNICDVSPYVDDLEKYTCEKFDRMLGVKKPKHLCSFCNHKYPDCPAEADDVVFDGNDIVECGYHTERED